MKKIILILIFLAFVNLIYAQSERIDVTLTEYRAESGYSRLGIVNFYSVDLSNVKVKIDESPEFAVVELLKSGGTVYTILNVPAGEHSVTITSDQKSETKSILFASSKEKVTEQKQLEKEAVQQENLRQEELEKIAEKNALDAQAKIDFENSLTADEGFKGNKFLIIGIIVLAIGIGIIYWMIKKNV